MSAILRFAKSRPILFGAGYSLLKTTGCDLMVQKVRARVEASGPCHKTGMARLPARPERPSGRGLAAALGSSEPSPGSDRGLWSASITASIAASTAMPLSRRVPTTGGREAREHRLEARRHVIGSGEA